MRISTNDDAKSLLTEAESSAERSIAFMRFGIGVAVSVFFFGVVSPTLPDDNPARILRPYFATFTIGYIAVGLATFYFARPERFRGWMTWLFTTCDLCFWYAVMVAAVLFIDLPGYFIVVVPPVFLVFVILAVVAMRNNPWLQIYALAFVTVALIALFVLAPKPEDDSVNVAETAVALFQLRTNIVRLSMIVMAGLILVYVSVRTRRLLNRAIAETVRRTNLARYLPPQLAGRLAQDDQDALLSGALQEAAILFADIRGFTTLAEGMEPETLGRFVAEYRRIVTAQVHACHGIVDKFVGDSVMAVFGAPDSGGNDAANALECARGIVQSVADWNIQRRAENLAEISVGVGVHWGRVFCGAVGDADRLEFTVLGDPVNVAARLEQLTKTVGQPIVASAQLLAQAGERQPQDNGWNAVSDVQIRGRSGQLQIFARS